MNKCILPMLLVLLSGCAVTSNIQTQKPLEASLNNHSSLAIEVARTAKAGTKEEFEKVKENLVNAIATKLPSRTGLRFASDASEADLLLKVNITHLVYTGQGARIMTGIMSGNAALETEIKLIETASGNVLWEVATDAASKKSQGAFGGSTTTQVEALSNQLVTELESRIKAK